MRNSFALLFVLILCFYAGNSQPAVFLVPTERFFYAFRNQSPDEIRDRCGGDVAPNCAVS